MHAPMTEGCGGIAKARSGSSPDFSNSGTHVEYRSSPLTNSYHCILSGVSLMFA